MSALTDSSTVIIFAYAPAGLGHLRVSRAIRLGLPPQLHPILLPDPAGSVSSIHRFTSSSPLGKKILEITQYGIIEDIFTKLYRTFLIHDAPKLEQKILDVLKQQTDLPKTVLIVCTHFGIAHQVSFLKKSIEQKGNVRIILVVQVTDDSPQKLWYVPNADTIFVPSESTRLQLLQYKRAEHLAPSHIQTIPYPISPLLNEHLHGNEIDTRESQADPSSTRRIHIAVPLSGAQVGMSFASTLMHTLHRQNDRFHFHIIGKRTIFSQLYLSSWNGKNYATIYQSHSDRQIVELYEEAYKETVFSAEITKPSEQAFKALLEPRNRGGGILFFTEPVGRQEYDNLNFLRRHELIPDDETQNELYDVFTNRNALIPKTLTSMLKRYRGLILPSDPIMAAEFIHWFHSTHGFEFMMKYQRMNTSTEISDTGVQQFWEKVSSLLSS